MTKFKSSDVFIFFLNSIIGDYCNQDCWWKVLNNLCMSMANTSFLLEGSHNHSLNILNKL